MKEYPIPFRPEMVRAILEGRKIQTRRLIKTVDGGDGLVETHGDKGEAIFTDKILDAVSNVGHFRLARCQYGGVGDRLWVREALCIEKTATRSEYECGHFTYKADDDAGLWTSANGFRTIPGMLMPRWACRLVLVITKIRVERVQDISWMDATYEGIPHTFPEVDRSHFAKLWNSINEKKGRGWDANPWVWVIDFRKVEP